MHELNFSVVFIFSKKRKITEIVYVYVRLQVYKKCNVIKQTVECSKILKTFTESDFRIIICKYY